MQELYTHLISITPENPPSNLTLESAPSRKDREPENTEPGILGEAPAPLILCLRENGEVVSLQSLWRREVEESEHRHLCRDPRTRHAAPANARIIQAERSSSPKNFDVVIDLLYC